MTPPPQKEYIITDAQLKKYEGLFFLDDNALDDFKKIRSRPTPSPQSTDDAIPFSDWLSINNAKVRNATLDIIRKFDECCCPHEMCHRGDGHDGLNCRECVIKFIEESLLTPSTQEQP